MLKLLAFVVPLGLDTFAVASALGTRRLDRRTGLRLSLLMVGFEVAMPLVGLGLGRAAGSVVGGAADYVAAAGLIAVGLWMVLAEDDDADELVGLHGLALVALGLSISIDELAIGVTIGLLGLPIVAAVILIGVQAFLFAQLGLRLGARVGERLREGAGRIAGIVLIALGVLTLIEKIF